MSLYIGDTNLSIGLKGADGLNGADGKSAYQIAQENGYTGTEQEFGELLSQVVEAQMLFGRFNSQTTWNDTDTIYTSTWTYNGDNYKTVLTEVSDTQYTKQLFINEVSVGTWTYTINELNRVSNTVYSST